MKKLYAVYMTLLLVLGLMQSCSSVNSKVSSTCEKVGTTYVYADKFGNSKIILLPTGDFVYSESSDGMLVEICQCNKGRWYQKKDTIYLTTLYQGDYITELEDSISNDSILVFFYSLRTGNPTDNFAYVNGGDSLVFPTTKGYLYISCTEKGSLAQQLLIGMDMAEQGDGVTLECGRAYKYYIRDCFPILMREKMFILTDSCLLDISSSRSYHMAPPHTETHLLKMHQNDYSNYLISILFKWRLEISS